MALRVLNMMFSTQLGGIEQSFVDYTHALQAKGHHVACVINHQNLITPALGERIPIYPIETRQWNFRSLYHLYHLWRKEKPQLILCHTSQAIKLVRFFQKIFPFSRKIPLIGICHGQRLTHLLRADYLISVNNTFRQEALKKGFKAEEVTLIPNMIDAKSWLSPKNPATDPFSNNPLVIGTMGRFVEKKGFHVFLKALALLRDQGISFKAILGGEGEEGGFLKSLATELSLTDHVTFMGWVKDKESFFHKADIFCLPSLKEPFGIVVLEAMLMGLPVVCTKTDGPLSFISPHKTGLLVDINDPQGLAESLKYLLQEAEKRRLLAQAGQEMVKATFDSEIVGSQLSAHLEAIVERWSNKEF